jgi:hypothetical protein
MKHTTKQLISRFYENLYTTLCAIVTLEQGPTYTNLFDLGKRAIQTNYRLDGKLQKTKLLASTE